MTVRETYLDMTTRAIVNVDPAYACEAGTRRISRVSVPTFSRGHGVGSRLMGEVCADADSDGVILTLEPIPYDGPERLDDLLRFYARFGFVFIPEVGCVRKPKANGE